MQLKPHVKQLDDSWLVRPRSQGHKAITATFKTHDEAVSFVAHTTEERKRGLFIDYSSALKVPLADLLVRYLLEEAPRHKSGAVLAYAFEGWLEDSGPRGLQLLEQYRDCSQMGSTRALNPR